MPEVSISERGLITRIICFSTTFPLRENFARYTRTALIESENSRVLQERRLVSSLETADCELHLRDTNYTCLSSHNTRENIYRKLYLFPLLFFFFESRFVRPRFFLSLEKKTSDCRNIYLYRIFFRQKKMSDNL